MIAKARQKVVHFVVKVKIYFIESSSQVFLCDSLPVGTEMFSNTVF